MVATANENREQEMFHTIMDEIREIRRRMDDHMADENQAFMKIARDIASIQVDIAGHKIKLGIISAGISLVIAAVVSWWLGR